jgi:periplasmic divalent cation tolerance protein
MATNYCVILTTAGGREEADRMADALVSRRLAACVQITEIASTYMWEGEVTRGAEWLLLIKTAARLYGAVESAILELHSYEVPEILQLPVEGGLDRYLDWIAENTH